MNKTLKWILIVIGILIFISIIIIGLVFYLRSTSPVIITDSASSSTTPPAGPPPLTFKNCEDRNKYCRNQCYGKIIIPGAGVTAALKCLDECKRSNPC